MGRHRALAMRHESLRTNYLIDASGAPLQFIATDDQARVMAQVAQGTADIAELPALEESSYRQVIDVHSQMPWRVWVITEDGVPEKLVVLIHHMAADGAAALIMQDDFHALLAGEELPPPSGQPRLMALDQQGAGGARLRAAERYWRRTLEASPRVPADRPADHPMIGGTLHTGIPLELAHEGATRLEVSLQTVVLAACYQALRRVTGRSEFLLFQIGQPVRPRRRDDGHLAQPVGWRRRPSTRASPSTTWPARCIGRRSTASIAPSATWTPSWGCERNPSRTPIPRWMPDTVSMRSRTARIRPGGTRNRRQRNSLSLASDRAAAIYVIARG